MDEVLAKAEEWRAAGEAVAIATVIATRRSAPRPLGSKLAVTGSGRLFGSVSGGCVEADVAERAQAVLAGEQPFVVSYGIADDEAWNVGLPCGGEIDVEDLNGGRRRALLLVAAGGDPHRDLDIDDRAVKALATDLYTDERRAQLGRSIDALVLRVRERPVAREAAIFLAADVDLAWRLFSLSLLAEELAE